jgi:hypothetical protein
MNDKFLKFAKGITKEQSKDSGLALVLIFLFLGVFLKSLAYVKIGLIILLLDMIWPLFFYWFAFLWFGLSKILSLVMTKILLGAVFYIFIVPVGMIRKILRKDTMDLNEFKKNTVSVFKDRNHFFGAEDIKNQF